jgi:hypothetical protein
VAIISTLTLTGVSGQTYEFNVYPLDQDFKDVGAVYVVTRRHKNSTGGHSHDKIYIGETGDLSTRFADHHKAICFRNNNANCICTHRDGDEESRLAKEGDLLKNYNFPCND